MKVIGITGKSGSGKTTLATLVAKKINGKYVDVDKIGHQALYQPEILGILCDKFGKSILDEDGKINRKKVGNIVFQSKDKMDILTDLTYGYMQKVLDDILENTNEVVVLDWILLPKTKYWEKCDFKILVQSDSNKRKSKVIERDKITEEYFDKRDSASLDYLPYKFDFIYENNYRIEETEKMVEMILEQELI